MFANEQVGWLDVSVNDVLLVQVTQALQGLRDYFPYFFFVDRLAGCFVSLDEHVYIAVFGLLGDDAERA